MNRDIQDKEGKGTLWKHKDQARALQVPLQVANTWLQWGKQTDRMPTETSADIDQWAKKDIKEKENITEEKGQGEGSG